MYTDNARAKKKGIFTKTLWAGGRNINPEVRKEVLVLPLSSRVTLSKLHSFSDPWLPQL